MYQSFTIKNFRCFKDFTISPLERVNLIVGRNNVGKTALLEAMYLSGVGAPDFDRLNSVIRGVRWDASSVGERVWSPLFSDYDMNHPILFEWEKGETEKRSLRFRLQGTKGRGDLLLVSSQGAEIYRYKENGGGGQEGSSQPPNAIPMKFCSSALASLEEDVEYMNQLSLERREKEIVDALATIEPRLTWVSFNKIGGMEMILCDVGLKNRMPLQLVGEGMSRLLSFVLAILRIENGILLIDEVENGFHYSAMKNVWTVLMEMARKYNVQIFATTHSWECIVKAHEAASENETYDMLMHRLDRIGDEIKAVAFDQEMLDTANELGLEPR